MKREPSSLSHWWTNIDLQVRLALIFTVLFAFSMIMLAIFLNSLIQNNEINSRAMQAFDRNRQVLQLQAKVQDYEQALNDYENSASDNYRADLEAQKVRIDESVAVLRPLLSEDDLTALDSFVANKQVIDQTIQAISDKIKAQDWAAVNQIDDKLYQDTLPAVYEALKTIHDHGLDDLGSIQDEVESFDTTIQLIIVLSVPAFLLLAIIAALLMYLQINQPLEDITNTAKELAAGGSDLKLILDDCERKDEIGYISREFVAMASATSNRTAALQQEAEEIRGKIRH